MKNKFLYFLIACFFCLISSESQPKPIQEINLSTFLEELKEGKHPEFSEGRGREIEILHLGNKIRSHQIREILILLKQRGFVVKGTLMDEDSFRSSLEAFSQRDSALRLREAPSESEGGVSSFKNLFRPKDIFSRMNNFAKRLFGLPNGLSFIYFKAKYFHKINSHQIIAAIESLIISNTLLFFGSRDISSSDAHLFCGMAALSAWVLTYIGNMRIISAFKGQGQIVSEDSTAPAGEQIRIRSSAPFMFGVGFIQELLINTILLVSLFDTSEIDSGMLLNSLTNATLSDLAKNPFDRKISDLMNEAAQAEESGDQEKALELEKKAFLIGRIGFNYILPAFKILHLLLPAILPPDLAPALRTIFQFFVPVAIVAAANTKLSTFSKIKNWVLRKGVKKVKDSHCEIALSFPNAS